MNLTPIAEQIIRASNRDHPADTVLRERLRAERQLSPDDRTEISAAVFAYFRWFGWLNARQPLSHQIARAKELATEFAADPSRFSEADLLKRAVPVWTAQEVPVTPGWVRTLQSPPKLWLRARKGQGTQLTHKLHRCRAFGQGRLADCLEYQGAVDLFRTAEFHAGEFELQDISSQAVSLICDPHPGETWWDACAGEGGKTLHLSELMDNKGLIWATDRAAWRLQRLKRRAARAKAFNYRTASWDGGAKLPTKTKFDGVLVDAPCTGIGTWHRNPHARWTTQPNDVAELSEVQLITLSRAATAVKPGGKLIYAVCTLAQSETAAVAEAFQQQFPDFEPLAVTNPLAEQAPPSPTIWLRPEEFGGSGMFIAVWRRQGSHAGKAALAASQNSTEPRP